MSLTVAVVDAEAAVKAWVDAHPDLTGVGKPLTAGAFLSEQRSSRNASYVVVRRLGGLPDSSDGPMATHRLSLDVWAPTTVAACAGADALANALWPLTLGQRTVMGTAVCDGVVIESLPLRVADPVPQLGHYVLTASFDLRAA